MEVHCIEIAAVEVIYIAFAAESDEVSLSAGRIPPSSDFRQCGSTLPLVEVSNRWSVRHSQSRLHVHSRRHDSKLEPLENGTSCNMCCVRGR